MSYYLLHRGWLDHELFGVDEPYCKRAAWAWLIEHAAYTARQVRIAGKLVTLQRGQLTYSLRYLARAWGWNQEKVRRFLADLAARDMVVTANATASVTAQTVVTICNYERYQAPDHMPRDSVRDAPSGDLVTKPNKEISFKNLSQPSLSPSPARAREAPPPQAPRPKPQPDAARPVLSEAGLAGLRDFIIPEEWVVEATSRRHAAGLPELNVRKEADKLQDRWRDAKRLPNDPWLAWIAWALIGRPDKTNAIEPQQLSREEYLRLIEEAKRQGLARLRAEEALERAA